MTLFRFALGVVAAAVVAAGVEALLEARDARDLPVRGRRVDAGGHRLRVLESGIGRPGPLVVLDAGIGGATAASWGWVQRGVEPFAPVLAYDRAGLGGSEPGPMPRDGRRLAEELHTMLHAAGHPGPYVLVAHSYGGLVARLFAERWPAEVAGAVLVDASHPRQFGGRRRLPGPFGIIHGLLPAAPWAARVGLMRLGTHLIPMDVNTLPPLERREQRAFLARAAHWDGVRREMEAWLPLTNDEALRTRGFGDHPLAVVSADHGRLFPAWNRLQDENAALSTNSAREVVPGATHGGLLSDSAAAARVVAAVHAVVTAARTGGRVALAPR